MFLHRKFLGDRSSSEVDDVVRNVRYLLESRRGAAWFRDDFGLQTEGFDTQERFVAALTEQIKQTLSRYEPRLDVIDVDEDYDDAGRVRLVVRCTIQGRDEALVISRDIEQDIRVERG